ncbi:hypothetical protein Tco_0804413 [Tanacetum coccineum]|uniref:Uncharacterized protein n=1 Tax=Tanacetum coccineum TaxID=301880 RepID=A0ABQ5A543_9ASTR
MEAVRSFTLSWYDRHPPLSYSSRPPTICYMHVCRYQLGYRKALKCGLKVLSVSKRNRLHSGLFCISKDSSIALTAFANADHAGCQDTRRSTSGSMQTCLGVGLVGVVWSVLKEEKRCDLVPEA